MVKKEKKHVEHKEHKLQKVDFEEQTRKLKNTGGKTFKEFKDFISRGNVVDMAVGVVIGSAFGKIVTSIVENIMMPLLGIVIGGIDFSGLSVEVGGATVTYGVFIQNVIDFLIVAFCIFIVVKIMSKFNKKKEPEVAPIPPKDEKVELLKEIRDLLKEER